MGVIEWSDTVEAQYAQQSAKWQTKKQMMVWTDLHGRRWNAMTRFQNRPFPVWVNQPRPADWSPPVPELLPPAEFLVPARGNRIQIAYAKWREQLRAAWRYRKGYQLQAATDLYGRKAGDAIAANDSAVLEAVGSMPLHPLFVDAMEAGDLWALGVPKADGTPRETPAWAEALLPSLKSVQKAEEAAELAAMKSAQFFTSDAPVRASGPFVPTEEYDEVEVAPVRKRGRPRKVTPIMDEEPADLATETDDDE